GDLLRRRETWSRSVAAAYVQQQSQGLGASCASTRRRRCSCAGARLSRVRRKQGRVVRERFSKTTTGGKREVARRCRCRSRIPACAGWRRQEPHWGGRWQLRRQSGGSSGKPAPRSQVARSAGRWYKPARPELPAPESVVANFCFGCG